MTWSLFQHLGKGGFGSVWKAKLKSKNMMVACKIIVDEFHGRQVPWANRIFQARSCCIQ